MGRPFFISLHAPAARSWLSHLCGVGMREEICRWGHDDLDRARCQWQLDAEDEGLQSGSVCNGQSVELPQYVPVDVIRPCGESVAYEEVLLRLNDGQVLAVFSANTAGDMTRLSLLPDGSYVNTDGSGCQFTLSTSSDGAERAISWWGQVQETWSMR